MLRLIITKGGCRTEVTIYADVLFLINFSFDYMTLYFTGKLMQAPMKLLRLTVAAVLGALYAVVSTVFPGSTLVQTILAIMVCALMCEISYRPREYRERLRLFIIQYIMSALFAGGVTLLYRFLLSAMPPFRPLNRSGPIPAIIILAAALVSLVLFLVQRCMRSRHRGEFADADILFGTAAVTLHCIVDSGNHLREPISTLPVLICQSSFFLPYREKFTSRLRAIPVQTIAGNDLLYGFRADKVIIRMDGQLFEREAVVALKNLQLSDACDGIIPAVLIQ